MRRHIRFGFTLVELLIVLGIIVLLGSILLSAISRAREEARRVQCLSNLRQLTVAWLTYANENRGRICSAESQAAEGRGTNGDPNHWVYSGPSGAFVNGTNAFAGIKSLPGFFSWSGYSVKTGVLWPYVKSEAVYICPDDVQQTSPTSYQMNGLLAGRVGTPKTLLSLNEIRRPSSTFVFIEGLNGSGVTTFNDGTGLGTLVLFIPFNSFVTPIYPAKTFTAKGGLPGQHHRGTKAHTDGTGISFADGHAIFWQYSDPRVGGVSESLYNLGTVNLEGNITQITNLITNSPDLFQLEAWSGGPIPPGVTP